MCINRPSLTRITEDFRLKTDTLAVKVAEGSQTGEVIRMDWKNILDKFGYDSSWKINATTDAAKNEKSARGKNRHPHVGLNIKYETDCVDHQVIFCLFNSIHFFPYSIFFSSTFWIKSLKKKLFFWWEQLKSVQPSLLTFQNLLCVAKKFSTFR